MFRLIRVGLALAGIAAAGLIIYELLNEALADAKTGAAEGPGNLPANRPPFAEASQYGTD